MRTTCGAYIIYNEQILLVHSTGNNMKLWNIPKGLCDKNETHEDAMYREVYEETNIVIAEYWHRCIDIGMETYRHNNKRLHGFVVILDEWNYDDIYCQSTYTTPEGIIRPEIDGFVWLPIDGALKYMHYTAKTLFERNRKNIERYLTE